MTPQGSIRDKLSRLVWRTLASALLAIALAMLAFQIWTYATTMIDRLSVVAKVVATNVAAALEFEEARQATKLLASIDGEKDIRLIAVFAQDGKFFAGRGHTETSPPNATEGSAWLQQNIATGMTAYRFDLHQVEYLEPVILHKETIGYVYLQASPERFYLQLVGSGILILVAILLAGWLAIYSTTRLQRRIVEPILRLADSVRQVTEEQKFSIRVPGGGTDEVGQLTTGFNEMLVQLEQRDRYLDERSRELAASNRDLEAAVADATDARMRAEDATRSKSMFLANMSHEVRTPMNGVLGMTELLLDSPLTDDQRRLAQTALRSGQALMGVINDILDFSKIEAGKLELDQTDFPLRDMFEDVVGLFAERAQGKGLEIHCQLAADLPLWVRADSGRLRQILANLLSNAIKFTEHGEIIVTTDVAEFSPEQVLLRVEVRDTGSGITAEQQQTVFDEFDQGDKGTARRHGGTGLGLSIIRSLSELMGGEVGLSSEPGVGSTFWFTVRLDLAPEQTRDDFEQDGDGLRGLKVLVVDDNATNRAILLANVFGWGMSADAAANGGEALAKLRLAAEGGLAYQIVLLDMLMPGVDGIGVTQRIRSDPLLAGIRVIMLTSLSRVGANQAALAAGVDRYVVKPVRKAQLFSGMRVALGLAAEDPTASTGTLEKSTALAGLSVLLVEDNPVNQEVASMTLRQLGCRVTVAGGGVEGVAAATSGQCDIILMDCQMPDIDGYEATRRIRDWELRQAARGSTAKRVPVIALTANAMLGSRETCLASGMDDFISKPFNRKALQALLERWVLPTRSVPIEDPVTTSPEPLSTLAFDPSAIASLLELGKDDFVQHVVKTYFKASADILKQMRNALEAADARGLARNAHALKSASGNVGLMAVADHARSIEMFGKAGDLEAARADFDLLMAAYPGALDTLRAATVPNVLSKVDQT